MLRKLIGSVRAAKYWVGALDKASRRDYLAALQSLEIACDAIGKKLGSLRTPYDFNMLGGHLHCCLGRYDEAIKMLNTAKDQIDIENNISRDERVYLKNYCNVDICHAAFHVGDQKQLELCNSEPKFDLRDVQKIRSRLRDNFPIG